MKKPGRKVWHSAFADSVFVEKINKSAGSGDAVFGIDDAENLKSGTHLTLYKVAIFLIAIIFIGRLFQLTVVFGGENKQLSESNRVRLVKVNAVRGGILDRNGKLIAQSFEQFRLSRGETSTDISKEQATDLEKLGLASQNYEGEMGRIEIGVSRRYELKESASHVLGYVSGFQGNNEETKSGLTEGEIIGRSGLEASYDNFLRGKDGKRLVEVDAEGSKISILGQEASVAGQNLKTTLDSGLQKVAYEAITKQAEKVKSFRGAVVIQDPRNGEVLALVSIPSFDPEDIGKHVREVNKPFFNRAVQGNYPPGSVFKIVTALSGLESGRMSRDTEVEDVGEFTLGGVKFSNWYFNSYGKKDSNVNVEKAIARSNDIYFYRLAEKTGLDVIRKMALKFGFGQKTGIDLPDEAFGLVPDEVWKKSALDEIWFTGDTLHLAIGQGFMLTTPMQVSNMTGYMAVGKLFKPHIVAQIGEGENVIRFESKLIGENFAAKENYEVVRSGMKLACSEGGTAFPFFEAPYSVGCKTGTAEQSVGNPNAWFTVFAPFEKPEITVTVLVEDGGEGSSVAAPVAREILDYWFSRR